MTLKCLAPMALRGSPDIAHFQCLGVFDSPRTPLGGRDTTRGVSSSGVLETHETLKTPVAVVLGLDVAGSEATVGCGQLFRRLADGAEVRCVLEGGHSSAHSWSAPTTASEPQPTRRRLR